MVRADQISLTCIARLNQTDTGVEQSSGFTLNITDTGSAKLGKAVIVIPAQYSELGALVLVSAPIDQTWNLTLLGHNITIWGSAEGLRTGESAVINFSGRNPNLVGDYIWNVEATQNTGQGGQDYLPAFVYQFSVTVTPILVITMSSVEILGGQCVNVSSVLEGSTSSAGGNVTYTLYSGIYPSGIEVDSITVEVINGTVLDNTAFFVNDPGFYYVLASYSGDANNAPFNGDDHVSLSVLATLTVDLAGEGVGKINEGGVDHTSNYSQSCTYGSIIALSAAPEVGSSFAGWGGDASGTDPLTLNVTRNLAITGTFTKNEYGLSVSVVGMGSVSIDPNQATYHYGDIAQLNAVPDIGWSFSGWSGDLTDLSSVVSLTVTGNTVVTATFVREEYQLSINLVGSGTVNMDPLQATYHYGDIVQLSAIPEAGWSFGAWTGDLTDSADLVNLTITGNMVVTATFVQNEYTLSVSVSGMGSVAVNPAKSTYHLGDVVELTAIPHEGWSFHCWLGDLSGSTNPASVTIHGNTVITAEFLCDILSVHATAGPHGSITPNGDFLVYYGSELTFAMTADPHYHIAKVVVDGALIGQVTSYKFTAIKTSHTIIVTFAPDTLTITASAGPHGSITPEGLVSFVYGSDQSFTITPDAHYHVKDVLVDGVSVGPVTSYTFREVTIDHSITASFAVDIMTIAASAGPHGSINPEGAVYFAYGTDQSFSIKADARYHIADVLVDGVSVGPVTAYTFKAIDQSHTISAVFAINTYIIEVISAHGSPTQSRIVSQGESLTASVTSPDGDSDHRWVCLGYSIDGCELRSGTEYIFTEINADHRIEFAWQEQYHLTVVSRHATPIGSGWYNAGTIAHASLSGGVAGGIAGTRYVFAQWSGDATGKDLTSDNLVINAAKTATATWTTQYYVEWRQTGVDATAAETVLTINGDAKMFSELPFATWIDDNTSVNYAYAKTIYSVVSGKKFDLASVSGPESTMVVKSSAMVSAVYDVSYHLDVVSAYGITLGTGWYLQGSSAQFSVNTPIDQGNRTMRILVAWSGDSTTTAATGTVLMTKPSSVTAIWETQYQVTFSTVIHGIVVHIPNVPETTVSGSKLLGAYYLAGYVLTVGPAPEIVSGKDGVRYVWQGWNLEGKLFTAGANLSFIVDGPHDASLVYGGQTLLIVNAIGINDSFTADLTIAASPATVHELTPASPIQQWIIQGGGTSLTISTPNRIGAGEWAIFEQWGGQVKGSGTDVSFAMTDPIAVDAVFFKINPVASAIPYSIIAAIVAMSIGGYIEKRKKKVEKPNRFNALAWGIMVFSAALIAAIGVSTAIAAEYSINALELLDFTNWAVIFVVAEAIAFLCGAVGLVTWMQYRRIRLPV